MLKKRGFTLIELLIVVAIIAILAAIAVPNFLEAQVRSKVSRSRADIRTLATALESYMVDWNKYPGDGADYCWPGFDGGARTYPYDAYWYVPDTVTSPIAYVTSAVFLDPFRESDSSYTILYRRYRYRYIDMTWGTAGIRPAPSSYYPFLRDWFGSWALNSAGPDQTYGPVYDVSTYPGTEYPQLPLPYDPTNGTVSDGDVIRSQTDSTGAK